MNIDQRAALEGILSAIQEAEYAKALDILPCSDETIKMFIGAIRVTLSKGLTK